MPVEEPHRIVCHLDALLESRGLTLTALAEQIGVSIVNLSVLKTNGPRPCASPPSPPCATPWPAHR